MSVADRGAGRNEMDAPRGSRDSVARPGTAGARNNCRDVSAADWTSSELAANQTHGDEASGVGAASAALGEASDGIRDSFGRVHDYLRLSITETCNYRCVYCGPATTHRGLSDDQILSLCSLFRSMGIRILRVTGGEPMLRPGYLGLIRKLSELGFERLVLTTNGANLARDAHALKEAGVHSVNVSLDAVEERLYASLTGGFPVEPVLEGIEAARAEGLEVKLNCVPMAGIYKDQARQLMAFAGQRGLPLRFIELMPFGGGARREGVSVADIVALLAAEYGEEAPGAARGSRDGHFVPCLAPEDGHAVGTTKLEAAPKESSVWGAGPAEYRRFGGVDVGLIGALTSCFCSRCRRLRLTNDGHLRLCLYHPEYLDLRALLEKGCSSEEMRLRVSEFVLTKRFRHNFQPGAVGQPLSSIGG